jgi:hypothetical protein
MTHFDERGRHFVSDDHDALHALLREKRSDARASGLDGVISRPCRR